MDSTIFLFLVQDGVINGAIYSVVALALVLVFTVTRIIFVPEGTFVAFAAFTMSALEAGKLPATTWLLVSLGCLSALSTLIISRRSLTFKALVLRLCFDLAIPMALLGLTVLLAPLKVSPPIAIALTLALIVPMGPLIYRIAFEPMQHASVLVLLIAALGVHFSLQGLGLFFFGPEGIGTTSLITSTFAVGDIVVTGQSLAVLLTTAVSLLLFALLFERTVLGKALRACASNRLGARLVGIPATAHVVAAGGPAISRGPAVVE